MTIRPRPVRGFTLVELAVAMAVLVILAGLAAVGLQRFKPRAGLASSAAQLTALLNAARQNALATGRDTVVMIFPQFQNPIGGTGRVVLYEDGNFNFFSPLAATNFSSYNPADPAAAGQADVLETLDLPRDVTFGFGGLAAPALARPYDLIAAAYSQIGLSVCSFCATGGDGRGAVVFNSRGRARFYQASGAPWLYPGGTLALQGPASMAGHRLVVITATTGSIKTFNNG